MANPTVDKLKAFGLRHGEKVAMGVTALIFGVCAYTAWSHPSIEVTPEEVVKTAKDANSNISRSMDKEKIIVELANRGVKLQDFEKKVVILQSGSVDVSKYKLPKPFVIPEPGAGLIRDMPELLAPTQLYVHSNRGAVRVVALDASGNVIQQAAEKERKARVKTPKSRPAMGGMGAGARKAPRKKPTGNTADKEKQKEDDDAAARTEKSIAGREDLAKVEEKPEESAAVDSANAETTLQGYRFINIVGRFDHKEQTRLYAHALKEDPASAAPNYLRLDVERQEKNGDNTWGSWTKLNRKKFEEVTAILTGQELEIVPAESRISTLIDPLPDLEVGYLWGGHPASLVPAAKLVKKVPEVAKAITGMKGNPMGMAGGQIGGGRGKNTGVPGGGDYSAGMRPAMAGMGMDTGDSGLPPTKGAAQGIFEKTSADAIMIRAIDYDVVPDAVYHYRVRIVFANPNLGWESVAPGVDNKSKELNGPWSSLTHDVNVPADVATFARGKAPAPAGTIASQYSFQVVAWNEKDGLTVVRSFDQSPGQMIGEKQSISLPSTADKDKGKPTNHLIDFTSHQILADAVGGNRSMADIQPLGAIQLDVPVTALVIRADGMLVLRDEARDAASGELAEQKDIFERYKREAEAKGKKPDSNSGGMGKMMSGKGAGSNN